jgi:hypothetical protein
MRLRRNVKAEISKKLLAKKERGTHLTKDDIRYYAPFLDSIQLTKEEETFLHSEKGRHFRRDVFLWSTITLIFIIISFSGGLAYFYYQGALENQNIIANQAAESYKQLSLTRAKFEEENYNDLLAIKAGYKPNLFLLSVGIDNYLSKSISPIPGSVNGAQRVLAAFQDQKGRLFQEVSSILLIDSLATISNIFGSINDISSKINPWDYFVIYLCGHGSTKKDSIIEKDGTFVAYDSRTGEKEYKGDISGREFFKVLFPFKSKVILISDMDNQGHFFKHLFNMRQAKDINMLSHNIFGVNGSSFNQITKLLPDSVEKEEEGRLGVFSYALLKALNTKEADSDSNGVLYLDELVLHTGDFVKNNSFDQNVLTIVPPTFSNIPVIQFDDTFDLPLNSYPLSGSISDANVKKAVIKFHYATCSVDSLIDNQAFEEARDILLKKYYKLKNEKEQGLRKKLATRLIFHKPKEGDREEDVIWNLFLLDLILEKIDAPEFNELYKQVKGSLRFNLLISMYDLPNEAL